jgi:hypothetical protein
MWNFFASLDSYPSIFAAPPVPDPQHCLPYTHMDATILRSIIIKKIKIWQLFQNTFVGRTFPLPLYFLLLNLSKKCTKVVFACTGAYERRYQSGAAGTALSQHVQHWGEGSTLRSYQVLQLAQFKGIVSRKFAMLFWYRCKAKNFYTFFLFHPFLKISSFSCRIFD